ncbi:histidine kinase [Wenjunlia vitaminophila]|uniref:histidine kinase n=1 Tax=Wenjunlia vitaminophila TaxID=76728 RepID=A0A0T6LXJ7_WENVI|nr:histidine kinase [Wenjunlia vitaminophila]
MLPALRGLRVRLLVAFALVAGVSALTTGALTFREARNGMLQQSQDTTVRQFRDQVNTLAPALPFPPSQADLETFAAETARAGRSQGWRVLVTYGDIGATSRPEDGFEALTPRLREAVADRPSTAFQRVSTDQGPALVVGVPITFVTADGGTGGPTGVAAFVTVSQRNEQATIDALTQAVQRAVIPALALAVLLALLAARRVLQPVRRLREAARNMASGRLDTRLAVDGADELADLSSTFNDTAAALEASVAELRRMEARARRFAADVSHELRTPLAAMSAVTDVLDDSSESLDPDTATAVRLVSEETTKLARLVDDLMEISRFDAGAAALCLDDIDLAESVRRTLAARGWTDSVHAELPPPGALRGRVDPRRLDVVVANLVANAFRHGAPPVRVRLSSAGDAYSGASTAVIEVVDAGPGIPPQVLPHIFDRFFKADPARGRTGGSGLGLAITAENVHLHGGTVHAANLPGAGAVFTVRLPLQPQRPAVPAQATSRRGRR